MMQTIFKSFGIDTYGFIDASLCRMANQRLFSDMPKDARVVFILFPYYCGDCEKKISAYGAVYDYHLFAKEFFSSLENLIKEKYPESFAKGFADHSPYLECEGAAKAGLGIIGDNSLLITKKYSSFVFIGELVTSLTREELMAEGIPEGDGTVKRCEGCAACRAACPAGCAGKAQRDMCLSALTQKKGELSENETELIRQGGSIWGCDICQRVCPYTVSAKENGTIYTPIGFFKSSYISSEISEKIEKMDKPTFERYPFAWRKRATIQRNIEIIRGKK